MQEYTRAITYLLGNSERRDTTDIYYANTLLLMDKIYDKNIH